MNKIHDLLSIKLDILFIFGVKHRHYLQELGFLLRVPLLPSKRNTHHIPLFYQPVVAGGWLLELGDRLPLLLHCPALLLEDIHDLLELQPTLVVDIPLPARALILRFPVAGAGGLITLCFVQILKGRGV